MTVKDFQKHLISVIKWGWDGDYAASLLSKANDLKECAKIYRRVKLVAYRNFLCEGDALIYLIRHGKI